MKDKEKLKELLDKIDKIKHTSPEAYNLWMQIFGSIKPKLEQAIIESEKQSS